MFKKSLLALVLLTSNAYADTSLLIKKNSKTVIYNSVSFDDVYNAAYNNKYVIVTILENSVTGEKRDLIDDLVMADFNVVRIGTSLEKSSYLVSLESIKSLELNTNSMPLIQVRAGGGALPPKIVRPRKQ